MTRATGERLYRACRRCRQRKMKCNINGVGEPGTPPCLDCYRTGQECTFAESRRGGNYTHLRKLRRRSAQTPGNPARSLPPISNSGETLGTSSISTVELTGHSGYNDPIYTELRNPSDALQILAQAAFCNNDPPEECSGEQGADDMRQCHTSEDSFDLANSVRLSAPGRDFTSNSEEDVGLNRGIADFPLVLDGHLNLGTVVALLRRYAENYHSFVPIVPKYVLEPLNIDQVAVEEPFLLTTIMTIASKSDPDLENIHQWCWEYMKRLLLDTLLGASHAQQVGSVEGLLLLSEWVPYNQHEDSPNPSSRRTKAGVTEDSTAWSLVGQAVRLAYLLRLDRTSFREKFFGESKAQIDRKRLAWTFVYIADRQISVRMGQLFWSRGPALSTRFTAGDFPTLQPKSETDDDYASVLQATVELTQLFHNVHDILYSSKSRTMEIMLMGDYSRYLDDFLRALMAWHQSWGGLNVPLKLKHTLRLMHEYLCLYVNAFSFQSVISRASVTAKDFPVGSSSNYPQTSTLFPKGLMASPDGRYVFEAIRAAKMVLQVTAQIDTTDLRFMPSRFYLYGIHSAVFLYRANIFGALNVKGENDEVIKLVRGFMSALDNASVGRHHMGQRYSTLLKSFWFPDPSRSIEDTIEQILGQENVQNTSSKSQPIVGTHQTFDGPCSVGTIGNITPTTLSRASFDSSSFEPFYENFSNFDVDIFGLASQSGFNFDTLEWNPYLMASYTG